MRFIGTAIGVLAVASIGQAGIVGIDRRSDVGVFSSNDGKHEPNSKQTNGLGDFDAIVFGGNQFEGGEAWQTSSLTFGKDLSDVSVHLSADGITHHADVVSGSSFAIGFQVTDTPVRFNFEGTMSGTSPSSAHVRVDNLMAQSTRMFEKSVTGAASVDFADQGVLTPGFYQFTMFSRVDGSSIPTGSFAQLDANIRFTSTAIPLPPAVIGGSILLAGVVAGPRWRRVPLRNAH
jgi:hypothetical protein